MTPFDAGLQPERTLLAWRRTCLSLAMGSAIAIRFTATYLGTVAVLFSLCSLILAAAGWATATRRYQRAHRSLTTNNSQLGLGGTTVAITAAATAVLALAALTYALKR
jgi:uncharacterized membrane protein YidH (DUF202 family)